MNTEKRKITPSYLLQRILFPFQVLAAALITLAFSTTVLVLTPIFSRGASQLCRVQKNWARWLLRLFRIQISLDGDLPQQPVIFVANHSSYLDILVLISRLPRRLAFLGKKELNRIPVMGWAWQFAGNIPIHRKSFRTFLGSLEKAAEEIHSHRRSLVIFPEGTRSPDGRIHEFKRGVTRVAWMARAPILPLTINGARDRWKKGENFIHPGRISVILHPIIHPDYSRPRKTVEQEILRLSRKRIVSRYRGPGSR